MNNNRNVSTTHEQTEDYVVERINSRWQINFNESVEI